MTVMVRSMRRLCVVILLLLATGLPAAAETIRLRGDPWCPYNCGPDDPLPGFAIEMAKAVFKPLGVEVSYAILPWARAIDAVRRGEIEAVVGADPDGDEGKGLEFPQESTGYSATVLLVPADSPFTYRGIASLAGLTLGGSLGYAYERDIDAYIAANKTRPERVQLVSGDFPLRLNLAKLDARRVDAVLETDYVARYVLKSGMAKTALKILPLGATPSVVKIGFFPGHPRAKAWARAFDQGVAQLRETGALAAILAKYNLEDWALPKSPVTSLVR